MQIEKHIKIVPTPTGAVVFFAGQVCLTITEGSGQFVWNISPVFAKLTTGASTFRDIPFSWATHPTMAEAIADGLTRLDEMQAFYGVIDMPEDTYVGEHLNEGVDEEQLDEGVKTLVKNIKDSYTLKTNEGPVNLPDHHHLGTWKRKAGQGELLLRKHKFSGDIDIVANNSKYSPIAIADSENSAKAYLNRVGRLKEEVDEGTDYSGIHADVKRTGKTHEQLASEHRAYAKQMRLQGQDGLAVRSEMLANSHDKYIASLKKTNESVEDEEFLAESFVVRQVGQSRTQPARVMISAAAVINRAREMAKEAGSKTHGKFIKLAHSEIASMMKTESEELDEGFNDTDTVFLTPQTGPMAHMRYNTFKEGSAADHKKAIKYHTKDADRADPKMARFHDMRAKMHSDYLSGANEGFEGDQIEEGLVDSIKRGVKNIKRGLQGWDKNSVGPGGEKPGDPKDIVRRHKNYSDDTLRQLGKTSNFGFPFGKDAKAGDKTPRGLQRKVIDREMKKRGLSNEEFVQYEDALPAAFQSIKEDCRVEALAMSDSLLEAQQLANELFEDIVEEYLNELSKGTLASYKGQAITTMSKRIDAIGHPTNPKSVSKMAKVPKIPGLFWDKKRTPTDIKYRARDAERDRINLGIDRATRKLSEDLDEGKILDVEAKIKKHDSSKTADMSPADLFSHENIRKQLLAKRKVAQRDYNKRLNNEEVELDEAALSGDAYWKSKEAESKEEFLKAQRKALGLPEPVKRGRGKPTLIDRDLLKTRAHSNVEAGKRPTAGFDRNEKIHFVRHLKDHPDFADKHVSQAGRPTGTTKVAKQQKELAKKKQDTAFSMWAGLGKR